METNYNEIDEGTGYVGYQEAFKLISSNVRPAGAEETPLDLCVGRITAEDLIALLSYPSSDVSLKDGFAVNVPEFANIKAGGIQEIRVIAE